MVEAQPLRASSSPTSSPFRLTVSAGAGRRSNKLNLNGTATDRSADTARTPSPEQLGLESRTNSFFGSAEIGVRDVAVASLAVRREQSSIFGAGHESATYPSLTATIDLKRALASMRDSRSVDGLRVRLGLWRAGSDLTPYVVRSIYSGVQSSDGTELDNVATAAASQTLAPEITQGAEVGGMLQLMNNRIGVDLTLYAERTSDLLIPVVRASGAVATNAGVVTNKGIEAQLSVMPISTTTGMEWEISANYSKNKNLVESISSTSAVEMGPARWGMSLQARPGYALGAIVGTALRRDRSGRLVLNNGLPVADTGSARVLGAIAPSWTGGLTNTVRYRGFELSALLDIRRGGSVFSATNMWGSYAGTLQATAFRPDSGLLIEGTDLATGNANTTNVSTEAYFHALGSITEPWVYDAGFMKLREARVSYSLPLTMVYFLRAQSARLSIVGRNLALWTKVPNIDPETALSISTFQGLELGQLPSTRSIGIQITLTP
jgi:hypothetical protein